MRSAVSFRDYSSCCTHPHEVWYHICFEDLAAFVGVNRKEAAASGGGVFHAGLLFGFLKVTQSVDVPF